MFVWTPRPYLIQMNLMLQHYEITNNNVNTQNWGGGKIKNELKDYT